LAEFLRDEPRRSGEPKTAKPGNRASDQITLSMDRAHRHSSEAARKDLTMPSPIRDPLDRRGQTAAAIRSRLASAYERKDRQRRLCEEARSLIKGAIQQAMAMQEEDVAMRHRLWMQ
jgi:hypothetical protein